MTETQTARTISNAAHPSSSEKDSLITRLDTLLEQYLQTLDLYTTLTQQLSTDLSSAFFSLTQANFHNPSTVHYGRDRYDERVRATRRIAVTEEKEKGEEEKGEEEKGEEEKGEEESKFHFSTITATTATATAPPSPHSKTAEPDVSVDAGGGAERDEMGFTSPSPFSSNSIPTPTSTTTEEEEEQEQEKEDTTPKAPDPLRMFGILVPPALRSAQASFVHAVDGPVVRLARVKGELRALEREIGRVRKGVRRVVG
ncbi:hypothetical protein EKO04_002732 [Ascochyta lentis]|uniref:Vacuolar ATPase assembly protein VMA22 n=1 Tax=Ascochyta lentis TaxID=205686 RepID=A0A8H7J9U3_9PLEO|nr:hypothetical protein EKO04_002732 [Ascochyta lentis]